MIQIPARCSRPRILLAEDDDDLRDFLSTSLRSDGYDVLECRDGYEMLDHLEPWIAEDLPCPIDLIVSDVKMPRFDGLDVLELVQRFEGAPPIALITAFGSEETREAASRLGAAALMDKPLELEEFLQRIHALLPPPRPGAPRAFPAAQEDARGRVLLAEDDPDLRQLLSERLRREGFEVTECGNGMDVVSRLATLVLFGAPSNYDLVVSDVRLPGVTAFEILEAMSPCEDMPPAVLITAFGDLETHRRAARLGVPLLDKPVDLGALMETVHRVLEARSRGTGADRDERAKPHLD